MSIVEDFVRELDPIIAQAVRDSARSAYEAAATAARRMAVGLESMPSVSAAAALEMLAQILEKTCPAGSTPAPEAPPPDARH